MSAALDPFRARYPVFTAVVAGVLARSPFQAKAVVPFLTAQDDEFWSRAERAMARLDVVLRAAGIDAGKVADAYLGMCKEMLAEQIKFAKTGRYSMPSAAEAYDRVYADRSVMEPYMVGLALSQFLWPNHYRIYDMFVRLTAALPAPRHYLEIGAGHGLFLLQALDAFAETAATVIDLSPVSARLCGDVARAAFPGRPLTVLVSDLAAYDGAPADFVVMGEVLEHVDDPKSLLRHVHRLLDDDGRFFVTTCANCPAVDHVYLYDDAAHIERELAECGFEVIEALALPVANVPTKGGVAKQGLNYAALCRKVRS